MRKRKLNTCAYLRKKKLNAATVHQKPNKPQHIGEALKSALTSEWIECLFDSYDKMHRTGSLSRPFFRIKLPPKTLILNPRITFEVKITDISTFYKIEMQILCQ